MASPVSIRKMNITRYLGSIKRFLHTLHLQFTFASVFIQMRASLSLVNYFFFIFRLKPILFSDFPDDLRMLERVACSRLFGVMEDSYLPKVLADFDAATIELSNPNLSSAAPDEDSEAARNFHGESANFDENEHSEVHATFLGMQLLQGTIRIGLAILENSYFHNIGSLPFNGYGAFAQGYPSYGAYNLGLPSYLALPRPRLPAYCPKLLGQLKSFRYPGYGAATFGTYGNPRYGTIGCGGAYRYPSYRNGLPGYGFGRLQYGPFGRPFRRLGRVYTDAVVR